MGPRRQGRFTDPSARGLWRGGVLLRSGALRTIGLLLTLLVAGGGGALAAGKVDDLARVLERESSYKVRLQAAVVLGRLGDRNAVKPLARALEDSNHLVRGMAAQALGRLGAPEGAEALKALLKREKDKFVRAQAESALGLLGKTAGDDGGKAKVYVEIGGFTGGRAPPDSVESLRSALQKSLGALSSVSFSLTPSEKQSFAKSGRVGFLIDGNVARLDESVVGGATEVNCDVKVTVFRWPSRSLMSPGTSYGATVPSGSRERDIEAARAECLEASAGSIADDLKRFIEAYGG
jgi:hypothetical protein